MLILGLIFFQTWIITSRADSGDLVVEFSPKQLLELKMYNTQTINFTIFDLTAEEINSDYVYFFSQNMGVASVNPEYVKLSTQEIKNNTLTSSFNVTANFIGYDEIKLVLKDQNTAKRYSKAVNVTVVRTKRLIDTIFIICVITLMSIVFINFGCALDFEVIRNTLRRPIGPGVGCVTQFIFMPLISFALGQLLFSNSVAMQLGFFFTGISPGGGASNVWTIVLQGNMNLSLTMTTISTLAAFIMMPLWAFTLGQVIFHGGSLVIPYSKILQSAVSLLIPLSIGFAVQKFYPKISRIMVRILKPLSAVVIIFIVVFATVTNFYLFKLFTWQIVLAGLGLPFFGYLFGAILAKSFNLSIEDIIAISVETGVQNTGIAIFMLQFSLGQPEADLTTVAPVAVAAMTPLPLLCMCAIQKLCTPKQPILRNGEYRYQ
uniref:Uncharacterized protein n=1 Tax=Clastoptera arizonana TaxID=38151 RepID=A0A1B6CY20_9HEMI